MIPYRMNPIGSGWPREGSYGVFLTSSGAVVSSAMTMVGAVVSGSGILQNVYNRGVARETVVSAGGSMLISSGGTANSATVSSGGHLYVSSGGTATALSNRYGGTVVVSSAAVCSGYVQSNGTWGGIIGVLSGGTVSGGDLVIYNGGTASDIAVISAALHVYGGGHAYNISVISGTLQVYGGGHVYNIAADDAAALIFAVNSQTYVNGTYGTDAFEIANAYVSGYTVKKGSIQINSGVLADNVTVNYNASMVVQQGGSANSTTVSSGGKLYVSSGGTALNVVSSAGAIISAAEGAIITYAE